MPALSVVAVSNLDSSFDLTDTTNKKIHIKVDAATMSKDGTTGALQAKQSTMAYNATTKVLTHTKPDGTAENFDLSALATDINVVTAGSGYNATTRVLTLAQDDGGPTITVNLGDLKAINTANSTTVTLTGDGDGTALSAAVKVSSTAGNQLTTDANGLYVPAPPGTSIADTNSVDLVTNSGTISANVKISAGANNQVSIAADGLMVPKGAGVTASGGNGLTLSASAGAVSGSLVIDPAAGNVLSNSAAGLKVAATTAFNQQLTDAFGTHLAWARTGTATDAN